LSTTQFARSVERKLIDAKIFTTPTVVVNLQPQSRFVTVGGGVRAPQTIAWTPDLNLSSAIKRAGGQSDFGNIKRIKITRDGKNTLYNLKKRDKDPSQNPKLLPGDEVEVYESGV
jgi:protein involved in polysaccharide export with SLBB domain